MFEDIAIEALGRTLQIQNRNAFDLTNFMTSEAHPIAS
jgi:hypothetical protein